MTTKFNYEEYDMAYQYSTEFENGICCLSQSQFSFDGFSRGCPTMAYSKELPSIMATLSPFSTPIESNPLAKALL
jgi:hypothetical protein